MNVNCGHVTRQVWVHAAASGLQGCKELLKCFLKEA